MSVPNHIQTPARANNRFSRFAINGLAILLLAAAGYALFAPTVYNVSSRPMSPGWRNLKMIGLALHDYESDHGSFPPAFIENQQGKRMHSWRVLILPYLADLHEDDADRLAEIRKNRGFWEAREFDSREKVARRKATQLRDILADYDFSEPWNGPNNRRLSEKTINAFCCPRGDSDSMTDYLAVVGAATAWPENDQRRFQDFRDGTSNTIVVVESFGSDVRWSEPRDLDFQTMSFKINDESGDGVRGPSPDGARCLLADGSVRFLASDLESATLKAALTINGQEDDRLP